MADPGPPAPHRAATAIAVAAWALAVLAVTLLVIGAPPLDQDLLFFLVDVTVACVYGTVAAVILARRWHPVPWLLGLAALGGGLAAVGYAYGAAQAHSTLPTSVVIESLTSTAWVPGTLALFLVVPWLVRDHPLGPEWVGLAAGATLTIVTSVAVVVRQGTVNVIPLYWCAIVLGVATAGCVELRRRHGPSGEANGLGWLAVGTAILAVSFVPVLTTIAWLPYWLTPVLHLASQAVFPAAVLVVVLRNRLWGLRLVISRAVLAALLAGGLLIVYLVMTLLLSQVLPGDGLPQLLGAGVVAVAVQPLRLLAAGRVHRLVYGDAADPHRVAHRLGAQLVSKLLGRRPAGEPDRRHRPVDAAGVGDRRRRRAAAGAVGRAERTGHGGRAAAPRRAGRPVEVSRAARRAALLPRTTARCATSRPWSPPGS